MGLILGIVDDEKTKETLQRAVNDLGFKFSSSGSSSPDLPEKIKIPLSLVLVDTQADQVFIDLCRQYKPVCASQVIVLISRGDEKSIVEYRSMGVADCIVKPLRIPELKARIKTVLAINDAGNGRPAEELQCGRLQVDLARRRTFKDGMEIAVTRTGYRLLVYFLQHKSEVVTREELLREVWGYTRSGEDRNLVETAIRRLRKVIEDDPRNPECLHTIWGVGYRFEDPS